MAQLRGSKHGIKSEVEHTKFANERADGLAIQ